MAAPEPAPTSARVTDLIARMTLDEKLAQIVGFWEGEEGDSVAPMQGELASMGKLDQAMESGLGHLTRVYGTNPVDLNERAEYLWSRQRQLVNNTRLGIPALVHEEILTGLSVWKSATFPTPLAWGAAGDPELVERMGTLIGTSMRELGIHQGLAPVLDVVKDPRWGRVEECISEDPYLVGAIGTAYVQGVQSAGVHATLKHFVGYSASKAGRNFAPVSAGPRELADQLLIPFEMAILDGNARSVMHSYAEIDGVPVAANPELLTGVLRDQWGFDGVVVADYFGVAFLTHLHHVAPDMADAARQALIAGVDVELPTGDAYMAPLKAAIEAGDVDIALVDRALYRALAQKEELGLLDEDFSGEPPRDVVLDGPEHREVARTLAEESIVLVSNDGTLPIAPESRIAVIGPNADRFQALFGCYSFANHVLALRPGVDLGFVAEPAVVGLKQEFRDVEFVQGCAIDDDDTSGFEAAVGAATDAEIAVLVVGDNAGLFGRGTVGEGCDRDDLELPGVQRQLVEAVIATGTPVVLVLMTGRPYAVAWATEKCAAVVQAFFPGEEGASAIAGVLSGRVNPSGRLPVSLPRSSGTQPYTYLHPKLGSGTEVTNLDPSPAAVFGHGLSYSTFAYEAFEAAAHVPTSGTMTASVTVKNTGESAGGHIVQLYAHDVVGSVTRPVAQLVGFKRVYLEPGASAKVAFEVPTTRVAFTDRTMTRVVEPGEVTLWVGDSAHREAEASVELTGDSFPITNESPRLTKATTQS
ncbi:glycoside hydrolase family 3 C-terminal domain-containing protein [Demequina sp. TTPB684]|uniref:beta-xylosidase/alpha-l-arabinosidase n=1 Tax=unclassified Demequina TaxID=2620311 RepID=UPI001CF110B4|nr:MULTISPECIES: glycoside hydrolase family 3 N-terminal domain-containing protein [unclassified Demequina]MCB2413443.1 glycoside hydrolase family 3 C-terminal domain-containing protein [Demequina sp. TTPB684]UPU88748.1 glycoside hydrolase family 3 C-terminal domain-containing protein [Demequina sp. TMPB413]